jgi:hypothetical protein
MNLSIADACKLLGVSRATAYRMRKAGTLATRIAKAPRQVHDVPINAYYEGPDEKSSPRPAPWGEIAPPPQITEQIKTQEQTDRQFAERYLAGEVTDSFGNRHNSTSKVSALGPMQEGNLVSYWGLPKQKRKLSQQEQKQVQDIIAIRSAWTRGFSR